MTPDLLRDCFAFGGLGLIAVGLWLVFPPAAFVVTGALLMGLALWGRR